MQASLALIGALAAAGAWFGGWSAIFLLVALLLAGNVAFTFIAIVPVYERLLDPALAPEAPEALPLLRHWGRLHALRSAVGLIAFLLALFGLALGGLLRMAL